MLNAHQIQTLLNSEGSLTAQLEALAGRPLGVQILYQGYQRLTFAQKKSLGLPLAKAQIGWVRQVLLFGGDEQAWVQAISVFPLGSLRGQGGRFRALGAVPIGYLLFARQKKLPHTRTIDTKARQTVYDWYGKKILVWERFL